MTKEARDNGLSTWNSKVIESNGIYQILIPTSYFCGVSASWLLGMSLTSDFLLSPVVLGGTFMDFPGLEAGPLGLATFLGGLLLSCMYWEGVFFTSSGFLGTFLTPPRLGGERFCLLHWQMQANGRMSAQPRRWQKSTGLHLGPVSLASETWQRLFPGKPKALFLFLHLFQMKRPLRQILWLTITS